MTSNEFLEWVGRAVFLFSVVFVFACALAFVAIAVDAIKKESEPVFTIAPDSGGSRAAPQKPK